MIRRQFPYTQQHSQPRKDSVAINGFTVCIEWKRERLIRNCCNYLKSSYDGFGKQLGWGGFRMNSAYWPPWHHLIMIIMALPLRLIVTGAYCTTWIANPPPTPTLLLCDPSPTSRAPPPHSTFFSISSLILILKGKRRSHSEDNTCIGFTGAYAQRTEGTRRAGP